MQNQQQIEKVWNPDDLSILLEYPYTVLNNLKGISYVQDDYGSFLYFLNIYDGL